MQNEIPEVLNTFISVISFVLGCLIGSFLNVCICRIPKGESVVKPRSKCPKCGNGIAWYDNIPIVSWLILGAKCRNCGLTISWQYPLVEAITGVLFFVVYWKFGITVATPVYMLLIAGLVMTTFIDLTDWTIPDEVTLPGIPIGIVCSLIAMFFPQTGFLVHDVFDSLIGVAIGGGILYLLDQITVMLIKKRGMGFGDVKLLAMLGAFLGWKGVIATIILSSLVGSIVGLTVVFVQKQKGVEEEAHYLPFGPYLVLGGLLYLFFGSSLLAFYGQLVHMPDLAPALLMGW